MLGNMFYNGWQEILRVLILAAAGYLTLVCLLRISGKRTLSKMNMFDFTVTVAIGSMLATLILSNNTSLATGVTAFAALIGMQYLITWLSIRFKSVRLLVKGHPTLLYYNGEFLKQQMLTHRIPMEEMYFALRAQGISNFDDVYAVVLETNGQLSVVNQLNADIDHATALTGVLPTDKTKNLSYPIA